MFRFSILFVSIFLFYIPHLSAEPLPTEQTSNEASPINYKIIPVDYLKISIASNVRDTWKQNNFNHYVYNAINKCLCDMAKRVKIFVYNNEIVKILDLDKGSTPLEKSEFEKYKTIDEYVVFINDALQKPVDKVYIDYDRHLGFPSKIFIDPNKRLADNETNIDISNLNLLTIETPTSITE